MPRSSRRRMPWKMMSEKCKMKQKSSKMSTESFYLLVTRWRQLSAIRLLPMTQMALLTSASRPRRGTIEWTHAVNCPETCSWTTYQKIYMDLLMGNKEIMTISPRWTLRKAEEGKEKIFSIPWSRPEKKEAALSIHKGVASQTAWIRPLTISAQWVAKAAEVAMKLAA